MHDMRHMHSLAGPGVARDTSTEGGSIIVEGPSLRPIAHVRHQWKYYFAEHVLTKAKKGSTRSTAMSQGWLLFPGRMNMTDDERQSSQFTHSRLEKRYSGWKIDS